MIEITKENDEIKIVNKELSSILSQSKNNLS